MPDVTHTRVVQSLDGVWDFVHASDGIARKAHVPNPWQAEFPELRQRSGAATYTRRFARPAGAPGRETVLRFGAVSYLATVCVNGTEVGRHEGGYLPFDCVIPPGLFRDDNELTVDCVLPDGDPATAGAMSFGEIPHGKQSWYGPLGGLWQSVTLEVRDPVHLDHVAITADPVTGIVNAKLTIAGSATATLTVIAPDGKTVAESNVTTLSVANPLAWSPDSPQLYTLRIDLTADGLCDRTEHRFGFRSIATRNGQVLLNGQPFYMRGALDQDYYPEGICTPPSTAFLEDQLRKAKALGLNTLRCHIKIPDPRYYEVADRLGMLIWTEIPNVAFFTADSARRMKETMDAILQRDGNHPSIAIWTLINEDWGTRLCEDAEHRTWLKEMFDWLKGRDPTRLVVDNSACHGNFHVKTDLNDFHWYRSVPERRLEWDTLTAEFAAGADWTWTPFGDGERKGDEPLIVSEFGVWGLPDPAQVTINDAEPWWMETGQTWGDGAAYPHGVQARFDTLNMAPVFGSFENFIEQVQWYQFMNLKYEIEVMRRHPSIMGYVITEFTDVHWESNGLLDMNRNPRVFHDRFHSINADTVIVPTIDRYAGTAGTAFTLDLGVSTGGNAHGATVLNWQDATGQGGQIPLAALSPVSFGSAGQVTITLPEGPSRMLRIDLWLTEGGSEIARNQVDIAVHAKRVTTGLATVGSPDERLADWAKVLGYSVVPMDQAQVVLVHALDGAEIAHLQTGARYVVFADGTKKTNRNLRLDEGRREQPFIPIVDDLPGLPANPEGQLPNINLIARHGTMWRGDWIAGFSWIRRKGVFADLPGGPLVDLSYDRVVPHHVMTGFRTWEGAGPVHAGLVVGWVQKPAALIVERRVGRGGMVASTFRLFTEAPGADPLADTLFDRLVSLAATMPVDGHA
ncbi:MAG: hypothetical protein NTX73_06415 [Rhodobacterales bacterium]|nr:hypothetical protein [Rhodobacterales bacterium]